MKNDTISFEFIFADDVEEILSPSIVPGLANELSRVLNRLYDIQKGGDQQGDSHPIVLYVAGIRSGSVVVSFVARMKESIRLSIYSNPIGSVADSYTIIQGLQILLVSILHQTGLAQPIPPNLDTAPPKSLQITISEAAIKDGEVREGLEGLVNIADKSGAKRVVLYVTDASPSYLTNEGSNDPKLIGSLNNIDDVPYGHVNASIKLSTETIPFTNGVESGKFVIGVADLGQGQELPVLVRWNSSRPAPVPNSDDSWGYSVNIKGRIEKFDGKLNGASLRLSPQRGISIRARQVVGLLTVNTQTIDE